MATLKLTLVFISLVLMNSTFAQKSKRQIKLEIKQINQIHQPTYAKRDSLNFLYKVLNEKSNSTNDTLIKNQLKSKIVELNRYSFINNVKELENEFVFIKQNPSSIISLDILYLKITSHEAFNYLDKFTKSYSNLSSDLKESPKGVELKESLTNFKNSSIGMVAPEFKLRDSFNDSISILQYRRANEYLLLNFSSSKLASSKKEARFLKKIYKKYNSYGFNIMSISLDEQILDYRNYIEHEKIGSWKHVLLIMNEGSNLLENYFINFISQNVLIDKNGTIIGRSIENNEDNHYALENQLKQIFYYVKE